MKRNAKIWFMLVVSAVYICLSTGCLAAKDLKKADASNAWLENFTEEMGKVDGWKRVPMTAETSANVKAIDDPAQGKYLLLWDREDLLNTNKSIYFARDIAVTDFSGYEKIVFKMKGNGINNVIKLLLFDVDGGWIGLGDFLTASTEWQEFEALLKWPVYSTEWQDKYAGRPPAGSEKWKFDLTRVKSIRILQQDYTGTMNPTNPIAIKDFKLIKEESVSSKPGDLLWKVSSINSNGNMVVDGKPFFPLAIYSTIGTGKLSGVQGWFKAIKEAGFNMVQSYTVHSREEYKPFLDYAQEAGLKVMACTYPLIVQTPLPGEPAAREAEIAKRKEALKTHIETVRDHPAMGVYYTTDECYNAGIPKEQLQLFYDFIRSMDTVHPTLVVECTDAGFPTYRNATDMFGPDIYPIGNYKYYPTDITSIAKRLDLIKTVQRGTPPKPDLWVILQIFKSDGEATRFPTEGEMRAMTFLALTKDVKGIVYFILNWPNFTLPYSQSEPEHWGHVSNAINSVHTIFPALFSEKVVTGYGVNSDKIYSIAKEVQEGEKKYLYLLAVNPSDGKKLAAPLTVTFKDLPKINSATVQVLDEDATGGFKLGSIRKMEGSLSGFTDTFEENAVHVYKISTK